jgi:multidrug efflux pump subunit AcrA (membrane-fusion protein)
MVGRVVLRRRGRVAELPAGRPAPYTGRVASKLTRQYCRTGAGPINRAARRGFGLLAALWVTAALAGCNGGEGDAAKKAGGGGPAPEAVPVGVVPARADAVQRSVEVIGTLYGQEDTYISNKIPGRVTNIFVDIGDRVAPGQALAQLLKNDYQLGLNEKQALLDEALAALGVATVPGEDFDVETVPAVRRARLQARNAGAKFDRARQLHESEPPLISDQDFADLETEAQVAQSAYQAALLEARTLVRTARTRQAQVAIAEQVMRDTTIRAPRPWLPDGTGPLHPTTAPTEGTGGPATQPVADASGAAAIPPRPAGRDDDAEGPAGTGDGADKPYVVAARYSSEGELNAGLTRMFRLVIDDPLKMRANVPERHAGRIKVGQRVLVRIESEEKPAVGAVTRINPQIDPANRTFEVEVSVPNPAHTLKPGAFARAEIQTHVQPNVLLVPEKSVVSFAGVKKVFSVQDGRAVEIPVSTGARLGDWLEVTRGKDLKPGDPVVVEGVNRMSGGVPVTVREAGATTRPAASLAADAGAQR